MDTYHSLLLNTLRPERNIININVPMFPNTIMRFDSNITGVFSHGKLTANQHSSSHWLEADKATSLYEPKNKLTTNVCVADRNKLIVYVAVFL